MKLPIWVKIEGNWEVFPTHLLDTLVDGSQGFKFRMSENNDEKTAAFDKFRDYFEWNPLEEKPLTQRRWKWNWVHPIQYRLRDQ